jgi:hypothetical protein
MKNLLYAVLTIVVISSCSVSKISQFKGKYNSFLDKDEQEIFTEYHTLTSKKSDGSYIFRQFFPETRQMTVYYQYDHAAKLKNGPYKEWYDDGTLIADGQYLNNKKTGVWTHVYGSTGIYKDDQKEGEWRMKDKKGNVSAVYQYKNGKREGAFIIYDTLGMVTNKGMYKADTIFSQTMDVADFKEIQIMPMLASCMEDDLLMRKQCSEKTMLEHIYRNLRYPRIAREYGVQGQTVAKFVVDKDGSITDIELLKGLCQSISDEVKRVIKTLPKWNPGLQSGKPVKVLYTLPIKFGLQE